MMNELSANIKQVKDIKKSRSLLRRDEQNKVRLLNQNKAIIFLKQPSYCQSQHGLDIQA
jgi:hypothetical protein